MGQKSTRASRQCAYESTLVKTARKAAEKDKSMRSVRPRRLTDIWDSLAAAHVIQDLELSCHLMPRTDTPCVA